jgi:hypothetical protein
MTGAHHGAVRVRDVLKPARRGPTELGTRALQGPGRVARARAAAAGTMIATGAVEVLDEDLGAMLVRTLELYTALGEAGRQSRLDPDTPLYVDLTQLRAIPARADAELEVLVDRTHRATVAAALVVEFGLLGLRAVVQDGWVTGIDGQQSVSATLSVEWIRFGGGHQVPLDLTLAETSRGTSWNPFPFSRPIPLLDPEERSGAAAQ